MLQTGPTQLDKRFTLVPEWADHRACLIAWPTTACGWSRTQIEPLHQEIINFLEKIIERDHQEVHVLFSRQSDTRSLLKRFGQRIFLHEYSYNDVWMRDIGPLNVRDNQQRPALLNPTFNAWGDKYPCKLDNALTSEIFRQAQAIEDVLEGGALESNGECLIYNQRCFTPQRGYNSSSSKKRTLEKIFNQKLIPVDLPALSGDDTDGHIDTLLRFVQANEIVFDESLLTHRSFESALQIFDHNQFQCHSLPTVDLNPFPASYANFYFAAPDLILMPSWGLKTDQQAQAIVAEIFKGKVIGCPANTLIKQFGSWHCYALNIYQKEFFYA